MKINELREKDTGSLVALEKELAENLFASRLQKRSGQMTNTAKVTSTRRDLARVKTLLRARELGLEVVQGAGARSEAPEKKKAAKPEAKPAKAAEKKEAKPAKKPAKARGQGKAKSAKPAKKKKTGRK